MTESLKQGDLKILSYYSLLMAKCNNALCRMNRKLTNHTFHTLRFRCNSIKSLLMVVTSRKPNTRSGLMAAIRSWILLLIVLAVAGYFILAPQLKYLSGTVSVLTRVSLLWVYAGIIMVGVEFLFAGIAQYVAGNKSGSFRKITVLQLTGAFVNHFLPFNLGSVSLTARYYQRLGESSTRAVSLAMVPLTFQVAISIVLIALLSPVTLSHLLRTSAHTHLITLGLPIGLVLVLLCIIFVPKLRRLAGKMLAETTRAFISIRLWPDLPLLIATSAGYMFAWTAILIFSALAVHSPLNIFVAFIIYISSSVVQNFAPTPGGLGATEAYVTIALVSTGKSLPVAAAITILFRFVSFVIPIFPAILATVEVHRWRMIGTFREEFKNMRLNISKS